MHCRVCGYSLWNLSEPRCPECGTGFDLRRYRFKRGTVAFACPRCGHLHGGTGPAHVPTETAQAICLGCGKVMDTPAMRVVLLSDPRQAEAASADVLPWEEREHLGRWRAWGRTWALSMSRPGTMGAQLGTQRSWAEAYGFAAMNNLISHVPLGIVATAVIFSFALLITAKGTVSASFAWYWAWLLGGPMVAVFAAMAHPLFMVLLVALPAHLALAMSGPRRGGLGLTMRCVLYSEAPVVFMPVCTCCCWISIILLALFHVWPMVLSIVALRKAQGVSAGRATIAVLWLPGLLTVLTVGAVVLAIALS